MCFNARRDGRMRNYTCLPSCSPPLMRVIDGSFAVAGTRFQDMLELVGPASSSTIEHLPFISRVRDCAT